MSQSNKARHSTAWRTVGIVLAAVSVIAASVLSTLWLSGDLALMITGAPPADSEGDQGYRQITLTDALLACQAQADDEFGSSLSQLTLDRHSSRYVDAKNRFQLYFQMDLAASTVNDAVPHFVNCFVDGSQGTVVYFASVESQPNTQGQSGIFLGR